MGLGDYLDAEIECITVESNACKTSNLPTVLSSAGLGLTCKLSQKIGNCSRAVKYHHAVLDNSGKVYFERNLPFMFYDYFIDLNS